MPGSPGTYHDMTIRYRSYLLTRVRNNNQSRENQGVNWAKTAPKPEQKTPLSSLTFAQPWRTRIPGDVMATLILPLVQVFLCRVIRTFQEPSTIQHAQSVIAQNMFHLLSPSHQTLLHDPVGTRENGR